jgi:HEAT repeats/PBS lyase HEAT-like repeat
MDVGPEALQKDNPGSVTAGPLLTPGSYTVWVALKQNDPISPYSLWFPSGPFEVSAGKKYLVRVEDGAAPRVGWTEEHARLALYRNPGSQGAVYFNNATGSNKWYGIAVCLGGGGPGAGVKIAMSGFRFGFSIDNGKRLTYSTNGSSNSTVVKMDGQTTEFGHPSGKVVEPFAPLPNGGARSTWILNNVRFTQTLEPVTSQTGARDTVLVRWLIRNEDTKPHQVGLRLQLDTMIGQNDGVPFAVPGMSDMVTTTADFPKQGPIPHFIQALEVPNLKNPGTVAHLSLQLGGRIEAPGRVCLTHWPGFNFLTWDVPMRGLREGTEDSAVVLYWNEAPLAQNQEREIGFSYGLGDVKSTEGRIGTTTVSNAVQGRSFPVTVYVQDPVKGETLTVEPPPGVEIEGARTLAVPPIPATSKERTSIVTWMAKAIAAGKFEFTIRSSTGETQRQTVNVAIGAVVVEQKPPVQQLIQQLQDPSESTRLRAAKELGKLGSEAREAIPALQKALKDTDEDVRLVAARSLKMIQAAAGPSELVQRLIRELQSPDEIVRLKAAKDLGKLGSSAIDAIPALQKLSQDPDEDVRRVAANSIRLIQAGAGPSEGLQKLIQQLNSPDELTRLKAAKDLAKMGPAAKDALPALQKLLQDPDEDVRRVVASAMERIRGGPITAPGVVGNVAGTIWEGSETLPGFGKLKFQLEPDGKAYMFDAKSKVTGTWTQTGNQVKITFKDCVYDGTINGDVLAGNARFFDGATWTFSVTRVTAPAPVSQHANEKRFAVREPKAYADAKAQKSSAGKVVPYNAGQPVPRRNRD